MSLDIDRLIDNVAILDDYICSDHKPISFSVKCDVAKKLIDSDVGMCPTMILPSWHKCDFFVSLPCHVNYLDRLLKHVKVPV